ncbi:MAG: YlxR family protein [Actinobacteria bacterium]|nr:YlxR family protein [Actinomycetota bacterium]
MIESKVPERTCLSCRARRPKRELFRVGRDENGGLSVATGGRLRKVPGRGCYICPSDECIEKARITGGVNRALKCEVPGGLYLEMKKMASEGKR